MEKRMILAAAVVLSATLAAAGCGKKEDGGGPRPERFDPIYCSDVEGTGKSLKEKAEYFDEVAQKWHVPQGQDLYFSVIFKDNMKTVDQYVMSDNVGTWTALYSASQSFRYAATGSAEALDNLRRAVRGERDMMRITGVRGLFCRNFVNPALPGFPTAEQLSVWYPDCDLEKEHCKRFNEVKEGEFKGLWFKNDVSKDEYAAHMFSMAAAWELVDDPQVREMVKDVVVQVGDHMIENGLRITDIDGEVTTFGRMNALGMNDFPGFNVVLTLSWMKLAAAAAGKKYADYYDDCLLQKGGRIECVPGEHPKPYTAYMDDNGLNLDCKTNWNNHNMIQLAMYSLVRREGDGELKAEYRRVLRDRIWEADDPKPMSAQKNTLYTFFYLINRDPSDPWPQEAAREAMCTMKIFPETKGHHATDNFAKYQQKCTTRSDAPMTDVVIPVTETGMDNFLWIRNPYELEKEEENLKIVESPEDYLLAYWVGRYFGFITEEM